MRAPRLLKGRGVVTLGNSEAWATFSSDRVYLYVRGRAWNDDLPTLVVCLLNPSIADHLALDPTLWRVQAFALSAG
jgi:hypothetical protein